ncbi:hypothetical protein O181_007543 [Austropuccinia psidii MF-1]|uniref:Reverse transcriptase domain-containing protein n=1 Tax=Austropuccinia psidii MF-1 TaxID=1389203 RepID=A0A9Q3GHP0_9BASI|nr:hypothetical protein [Austropuccinia psidii MF-1]
MTSIGTIIKEMLIPHRKGNIRLNSEFVVLHDAHIQGFLLGTDYERMYCIDIYNNKSRHHTIGTNKEKKFSLDIYQVSAQDPLKQLLNEVREGLFRTTLTSKQKLSLLKMLRMNRPAFSIGEEPLGKIRGHDIELYLNLEIPYPPILRRPPYPESLETRKEIGKHVVEFLDMDVIRKIGDNEIVGITTPVLLTWNDGKCRQCGDFRALNNYTKADRYSIPRIPHALDKLEKAKYITKMDCMKGFHQNGGKPNSMKLLRIICHTDIYEYTSMTFSIKNASAHFQRMMYTIFQKEILEGWKVVYIDEIIIYSETWEDHAQYIDRVLSKCTPINLKISLKKCNFGQELLAVGHEVSGLSLAIDQIKVVALMKKQVSRNIKDMQSFLGFASYYNHQIKMFAHITSSLYKLPFRFYIDAECSQGLGAALQQRQIVDGEPREGAICYISRKLKDSEASLLSLHRLHSIEVMVIWQLAIQEYTGNITIIYKEGKDTTNADGLSGWPLVNVKSNTAHDPEEAAKIPICFMEIYREKNFKFFK